MVQEKRPPTLHLLATEGTANVWRSVAYELGYVAPRGKYVGQGSISQLMRALVSSEAGKATFDFDAFRDAIVEVSLSEDVAPSQ